MNNVNKLRITASIFFYLALIGGCVGAVGAFIIFSDNIVMGIFTVSVIMLCAFPSIFLFKAFLGIVADISETTICISQGIESIEKRLGYLGKKLDENNVGRNDYGGESDQLTDPLEKEKRVQEVVKERNEFVNLYNSGTLKDEEKAQTIEFIRQIEEEIKTLLPRCDINNNI